MKSWQTLNEVTSELRFSLVTSTLLCSLCNIAQKSNHGNLSSWARCTVLRCDQQKRNTSTSLNFSNPYRIKNENDNPMPDSNVKLKWLTYFICNKTKKPPECRNKESSMYKFKNVSYEFNFNLIFKKLLLGKKRLYNNYIDQKFVFIWYNDIILTFWLTFLLTFAYNMYLLQNILLFQKL